MSSRFLFVLAAVLATHALAAQTEPKSFLAGEGIAVFVPAGYDSSKTPSPELIAEPKDEGALPANFAVQPVFKHTPANGPKRPEHSEATVEAPAGTSFYGTGEETGHLLRNNTDVILWNTDSFKWGGGHATRLYQSHPWVLAVRPDGSAFGVLFDTTWKAHLQCRDHDIYFDAQGSPFRVIVIDRASPQEVLRGLAELIGATPLPPRWALGFHQCRYTYYPDARVRQIADGFRSRHIPCDVIWLDIDYMDGYRDFTFDPRRFPDPAATNRYLHDRGFKTVWMIDPGVKAEKGYSVYDSGCAHNVWVKTASGAEYHGKVWPGECAFPDFTSPAARDWWAAQYKNFLAKGIDGVWNDMNEPSIGDGPGGTMPEDNRHAGGGDLPPGPHVEYHNVYGMEEIRATQEGLEKARPDKRPFVLTRANFLGGQRYAATWTGDNVSRWTYLTQSVPMSLNLGLSGQPFSGPDIGGFAGSADPDLYGHWIGLGAFYPFSRAHKDKGCPDSEPWMFGPAVESAARTALERRYRLLPYLYTLFQDTSDTGLPVMRPIFMTDPKDASLRAEDQAFTIGADLLVIPRWAQDPHLPKGDWRVVDLIDPRLEADPYQPVLKIRPGAIIPLGKIIENTTGQSLDPLTLLVAPDASGHAEGWLYDDAGDGYGYRTGDYTLIHYVAQTRNGRVTVKIAESKGNRPLNHHGAVVEVVTGDHQTAPGQGEGL